MDPLDLLEQLAASSSIGSSLYPGLHIQQYPSYVSTQICEHPPLSTKHSFIPENTIQILTIIFVRKKSLFYGVTGILCF